MNVESVSINSIFPYHDNCKIHTEENLKLLKRSLLMFGQYKPLLVQKSTNEILVGNGTFEALKSIGKTVVDVVFLDVDDERARLINIADNKISNLSSWNERLIHKLENFNLDVVKDLSFDDKFLNKFRDVKVNLNSFAKTNKSDIPKEKSPKFVCCPQCNRSFMLQ